MKLRPLQGVQIVSICTNLPGPVVTYKLQCFGAKVLKIEPPQGDALMTAALEYYEFLTQNQKVVTLDLKNPNNKAKLEAYLKRADLFITSSRPKSLKPLGLDWKAFHRKFPRASMLSIVGYPAPHQNWAGHDLTYQAQAGLLQPPHMPRTCYADLAGAAEATAVALALLLNRLKTKVGNYAEVALSLSAADFAKPWQAGIAKPEGVLGGSLPEYNLYKTKDGWVALAALEPQFKQRLQEGLRVIALTHKSIQSALVHRTSEEWESWAKEIDLPLVAVKS